MRTPAGFECKYFYGDYFRGRSTEECRLLQASGQKWTPDLCRTCPVPGITRANACPNMVLHGKVEASFLGFRHRVRVTALCNFTHEKVAEPEIGCGHCHEMPVILSDEEK